MNKQKSQILYIIAGSITVFAAIAQFLRHFYAPFAFAIGALLLIINQFKIALDHREAKLREQRLTRINFMASLLLAIAAYLMFTNSNLWVIALLIYALVSLFTSFRGE